MVADDEPVKFRVKADLAVFEALQHDGKLSEEGLARETEISATTVHYSLDRMRKREFFDIRAVPRLERFGEVPVAVLGFSDVHPVKVEELVSRYGDREEIVQLLSSDKDIVITAMGSDRDALVKLLFDIMQCADEKPSIYMVLPKTVKWSSAIPDKVLDSVYNDLPDRRLKL